MTEEVELLPCGFCHEPLRDEGDWYWHPRTECYLAATSISKSDIHEIKRWNTRPSAKPIGYVNQEGLDRVKSGETWPVSVGMDNVPSDAYPVPVYLAPVSAIGERGVVEAARAALDYLRTLYNSGEIEGQVSGEIVSDLSSTLEAGEGEETEGQKTLREFRQNLANAKAAIEAGEAVVRVKPLRFEDSGRGEVECWTARREELKAATYSYGCDLNGGFWSQTPDGEREHGSLKEARDYVIAHDEKRILSALLPQQEDQ